ncbi:hypothetical protein [Kiloniella sp.]|uniref:hypothetical protein n=1 Tax=Kiloniella sp. TaxID=1938587 RepID=UPI003B029AC3
MLKPSRYLPLILIATLTGCANSALERAANPDKVSVQVAGNSYGVIQRTSDRADVWNSGVRVVNDAFAMKQDQILAVEKATGCKVVDFISIDPANGQAKIRC